MFVAVGAWSSVAAPVAGAHALVDSTSPVAGAVLRVVPEQNVIVFNEGISATPGAVRLIDPAGQEVRGLTSEVESGSELVTPLPELSLEGSYTLAWKAVSADGHPISGAYLFHLGEATLTEPVDVGEGASPLVPGALRALGAVIALGAAAFLVATGATSVRAWAAAVAGTALTLAGAVVAVGGPVGEATGLALSTMSGRMSLISVLTASVGTALAALRFAPGAAAALGMMVVSIAAQGHAVALAPLWRSATLTILHVVAAVGWGAALLYIGRLAAGDAPDERTFGAARAFSRWGAAAVVTVAVTGVVLVVGRVPPEDLLRYGYGRVAVLKVVLLVVAVVLAVANRGSIGVDEANLRRGIRAESVVLALALVAGGVLAQVPPPDVSDAGGDTVVAQRVAFGPGELDLTVEPGRRGTNEVHVVALDPSGALMDGIGDIKLFMSLPSQDLGPLEPEMTVVTQGHSLSYAEVPLEGDWRFEVTARTDDFTEYSAEFEVPIKR